MIPPSRVVVLTRIGCHLCESAEATAAAICEEAGATLRIIDVDTVEGFKARFNDHVPVTFVDQKLLSYWFLDADALRGALAAEPKPATEQWLMSLVD